MSTEQAQITEPQQVSTSHEAAKAIARYWQTHATEATVKQALFLQGLRQTGTVLHAAEFAGINRVTAYQWRQLFPDFKLAWDDALEDPVDRVEKTLYEMATSGNNVTATMSYLRHNRAKYREETRIIVAKEVDETIDRAIMAHQLPTSLEPVNGIDAIPSSELDHMAHPDQPGE